MLRIRIYESKQAHSSVRTFAISELPLVAFSSIGNLISAAKAGSLLTLRQSLHNFADQLSLNRTIQCLLVVFCSSHCYLIMRVSETWLLFECLELSSFFSIVDHVCYQEFVHSKTYKWSKFPKETAANHFPIPEYGPRESSAPLRWNRQNYSVPSI